MNILVVGGAGYIGAHTVRALQAAGYNPVVFDNLSTGHGQVTDRLGVEFIHADLDKPNELAGAFEGRSFEAVIHFAAFALVGESVSNPAKYYRNNVVGTLNLLDAMRQHHVSRIVFSSTCATYGVPDSPTIDESHPQRPINPYGRSKLMVEQALADYDAAYGIKHVALRYFNAAGASSDGLIGEDHDPETHLIPLCLMTAAGQRRELSIFGTDYPTPDGTCIRDYVHVDDLAQAHLLALAKLQAAGESRQLNVGVGTGYSVREVIQCSEQVTGRSIPIREEGRRPGDPPILVAAGDRVRHELGWAPRFTDLRPIVETAWQWFRNGGRYNDRPR